MTIAIILIIFLAIAIFCCTELSQVIGIIACVVITIGIIVWIIVQEINVSDDIKSGDHQNDKYHEQH